MFILHLANGKVLLFIHIPKCAGVMVRRQFKAIAMRKNLLFNSFWGINNDIDMAHIPLAYSLRYKPDLMDILDNPNQELVPFTITKNPYDRLWSGFQFEKTANWIPRNPLYQDDNLDFNGFVERHLPQINEDQLARFSENRDMYLGGIHFVPQTLILAPNPRFEIERENILSQENINDEFMDFMIRNGAFENEEESNTFYKSLKPQNCSNLSNPPEKYAYTQYYSGQSIEIINDLFKDEFDTFGYEKIDSSTHDTDKLQGYFGGQSSGKL